MNLFEGLDAAILQGIGGRVSRIWVTTDTSSIVVDPNTQYKITDGCILLLKPFGKCIAPAFSHTTCFSSLQAAPRSSLIRMISIMSLSKVYASYSGHTVGGPVGLFMGDNLINKLKTIIEREMGFLRHLKGHRRDLVCSESRHTYEHAKDGQVHVSAFKTTETL